MALARCTARSFGPVAARIAEPRSDIFLSFEEGIYDCDNLAELGRLGQLVKEAVDELTADELAALRGAYREQRDKLGGYRAAGVKRRRRLIWKKGAIGFGRAAIAPLGARSTWWPKKGTSWFLSR